MSIPICKLEFGMHVLDQVGWTPCLSYTVRRSMPASLHQMAALPTLSVKTLAATLALRSPSDMKSMARWRGIRIGRTLGEKESHCRVVVVHKLERADSKA